MHVLFSNVTNKTVLKVSHIYGIFAGQQQQQKNMTDLLILERQKRRNE